MSNNQQNLLIELGLDSLPKEEQEELIIRIGEIIQERVIIRVLDELNEKDREEFDKILEEKGEEDDAVLNFLRLKILNLDQIVEEEVSGFRRESVELMKKVAV